MVGRNKQRDMARARLADIVNKNGRMNMSQLAKASGLPVNAIKPMVHTLAARKQISIEIVRVPTPNRRSLDDRQVIVPVMLGEAEYPAWMTGAAPVAQEIEE